MTIKMKRSELAQLLAVLSPYMPGNFPIAGIRIKNKVLELLTQTDHGSALAQLSCKAKDQEWTFMDGTKLYELAKIADDGVVEMDFTVTGLLLHFPGSISEIRCTKPLFSSMPKLAISANVPTIKGRDLALLSTMTEAASTDEARPNLNGIFIEATGDEIKAAAADGYILSFASFAERKLEPSKGSYSVKALLQAKRAIKPVDEEDVAILVSREGMILSVKRENVSFTFSIPRIGDNFPDYMQIVKSATATKDVSVQLDTRVFESFLKRAKAIDGSIYLQAVNGFLWMMAENKAEENKSLDSFAIATTEESPVMFFSAPLLKDVIKACAANGHIELIFPKQTNLPMIITGQTSVIAMPLRNDLKESPFKQLQPALI
jgi:hypothetical protein